MAAGDGALVVLSTVGSADEAQRLATALVEERLVACGNAVGPITSTYRWKGKLCCEPEFLLILKTRRDRLGELVARLKSLHSYECPEILALPVEAGFKGYLSWLVENTTPGEGTEEEGVGARD
ncbi:MAG: divalent-cation tolerance protein CutA [Candidatus Riflebacteria bacterium]|nr:divalent-cation tolerance protein CutA [Candidatus Riflebacteria bacterium]